MERIFYKGQDITKTIERKENKIIELYSKQRKIPIEIAEMIYSLSNLRKAFRNVVTDLWTQSEQYIVEAYSDVLDDVDIDTLLKHIKSTNDNLNVAPTTVIEEDESRLAMFESKWLEAYQNYIQSIGGKKFQPLMPGRKPEWLDIPVVTKINEGIFSGMFDQISGNFVEDGYKIEHGSFIQTGEEDSLDVEIPHNTTGYIKKK